MECLLLVSSHIDGKTQAEGVREQCAEEDMKMFEPKR
jgi:hypothetical protein